MKSDKRFLLTTGWLLGIHAMSLTVMSLFRLTEFASLHSMITDHAASILKAFTIGVWFDNHGGISLALSEAGIPAACETDIAGAVSMLALTLASGEPSAIADWNNNFAEDRNKCVCTHCGNFPKSFIGNDNLRLGPLGVLGRTLGKINTFGAVYAKVSAGDFTFFRISTDDTKGCIKAYVGEGKMTDDPYAMDGCIVVTEVPQLQKLMKHICKNGFEHHVALVRADVAGIIEEAIDSYLGWNLYVHGQE